MPTLNPFDILLGAVGGAVSRMAGRADNPLTAEMAPTITRAIVEEIAADPAVRHATNAEPWYASRVTWGAIIAAAAPIVGLILGHSLTAEDQASLGEIAVALATLTGAGLALYGRWRARTPLRLK
ncbi:hypothetical protein K32_14580 [Kaistia sp. 32K]|uniref:hypothetical protein n=1 Tax=Kaistia sp. 32K TaxID=2795690 RepID=UPI001916AE01|nr:hypothetical protein [Kaistia sp. 32K]BCP52841.1 hypothetical protein K32_14580 [Kaistia sp. 32K]